MVKTSKSAHCCSLKVHKISEKMTDEIWNTYSKWELKPTKKNKFYDSMAGKKSIVFMIYLAKAVFFMLKMSKYAQCCSLKVHKI